MALSSSCSAAAVPLEPELDGDLAHHEVPFFPWTPPPLGEALALVVGVPLSVLPVTAFWITLFEDPFFLDHSRF